MPRALVIIALIGAALVPIGSSASTTAVGSARGDSTLLRLRLGDAIAEVAADGSEAIRGPSSSATAAMLVGRVDGTEVGFHSRSASDPAGNGEDRSTAAHLSIEDFLGLSAVDLVVATDVADTVRSRAALSTAAIDLMGSLVQTSAADTLSDSSAGPNGASAVRSISVGSVDLLSVDALMAAFGLAPADLTCEAAEALGSVLGVPGAADSCATLDAVNATLSDALALIDAELAAIDAQREEAIAERSTAQDRVDDAAAAVADARDRRDVAEETLASLRDDESELSGQLDDAERERSEAAAVCDSLPVLARGLCRTATVDPIDEDIDALQDELDAIADAIDAALDEVAEQNQLLEGLNDDLDAADAELDRASSDVVALDDARRALAEAREAATGSCTGPRDAAEAIESASPDLAATLAALGSQIEDDCAELTAALADLLTVPVLSLRGVELTIAADARGDDPSVAVTGAVAQVAVGLLAPFAVDVTTVTESLDAIAATAEAAIADVASALGVEAPMPSVEFFAIDASAGQDEDGRWFANGAVTLLDLQLPSATFHGPTGTSMDLLGEATGSSSASTPHLRSTFGRLVGQSTYAAEAEEPIDDDDDGLDETPADESDPSDTELPEVPDGPLDEGDDGDDAVEVPVPDTTDESGDAGDELLEPGDEVEPGAPLEIPMSDPTQPNDDGATDDDDTASGDPDVIEDGASDPEADTGNGTPDVGGALDPNGDGGAAGGPGGNGGSGDSGPDAPPAADPDDFEPLVSPQFGQDRGELIGAPADPFDGSATSSVPLASTGLAVISILVLGAGSLVAGVGLRGAGALASRARRDERS